MSADRSFDVPEESTIGLMDQLANLQARYGDLEDEHIKLEKEMAERLISHERLAMTIARLEKRNKTLVSRQTAQVKEEAFELERQEKSETEKTLNTRIQQLQQELRSVQSKLERLTPSTPLSQSAEHYSDSLVPSDEQSFIAQVALISQLRAELADMTESQLSLTEMHTALQLRVHTLEHEVAERTAACYRLREENEGFEILLRERTLDGRVYDADVFGDMSDESASETEASEAASQGIQSVSRKGKSRTHSAGSSSQQADSPRSRVKSQGRDLANYLLDGAISWYSQSGFSATDEGRMADGNVEAISGELTVGVKEDPAILILKAEVRTLTDANKALRLYCSKILDRILVHDDEEQFLVNVSGSMNRATGQRNAGTLNADGRQAGGRNRGAVTPEVYTRAYSPSQSRTAMPLVLEPGRGPAASTAVSSALHKGGLQESQESQAGTSLRPLSIVAKKEVRERKLKKENEPCERKLQRGFSLDWRAISGSWRVENEKIEDEVGAVQEMIEGTVYSTKSLDPGHPPMARSASRDRKLDISEEDDEDRIERERLATTLKLLGLPTDEHGLSPQNNENLFAVKGNEEGTRPTSPFVKFSAFFGRPASATSASLMDDAPSRSPHKISVSSLNLADVAEGKVPEDRTGAGSEGCSGNPGLSSRAGANRQTLSASQTSTLSESLDALRQSHRRTTGGDASLDTLWSLGSDGHDL